MLRLQPHAITAHQQGGCLYVMYCHSPEVSFVPFCLNAVRRTLLRFSSHLTLLAIKANSTEGLFSDLYPCAVFLGTRDGYLDFINRLRSLFFRINQKSLCHIVRLKSLGPLVVVAGHLLLPPTLEILTPNKYLTSLNTNCCLNLCLIFSCYSLSCDCLFSQPKPQLKWKEIARLNYSYLLKCSFYAFRFTFPKDKTSQEIALLELLGPGTYALCGIVLSSFMTLFRSFQGISKVVLNEFVEPFA